MAENLTTRTARIDENIAHARASYLHATWAGDADAAGLYSGEVDRLLDLRCRVARGELTAS
jgi:hypothetical protein